MSKEPIKLELTDEELGLILAALAELPFKVVNRLIADIVSTARKQAEQPPEET